MFLVLILAPVAFGILRDILQWQVYLWAHETIASSFSMKLCSTLIYYLLDSATSSNLPRIFFHGLVQEFFLQSLFHSLSGSVSELQSFSTLLLQWNVELHSSLSELTEVSWKMKPDCCVVLIQQKPCTQAKLRRADRHESSNVIGNCKRIYFLYIMFQCKDFQCESTEQNKIIYEKCFVLWFFNSSYRQAMSYWNSSF